MIELETGIRRDSKKNINEYVSNKIKETRIENNKTLKEIANQMELTPTTIYRYEKNIRTINFENLLLFCNLFDLSLSEFFIEYK
ncbi:MAG: helix-turn-helix domain-containing protein [Culicoidibacterales bacterium]